MGSLVGEREGEGTVGALRFGTLDSPCLIRIKVFIFFSAEDVFYIGCVQYKKLGVKKTAGGGSRARIRAGWKKPLCACVGGG